MKFFVTYHPVRLISDSPKYTFTYEVQHNWFLLKVNVHNFNNHYCIRIINIITEDAGYTHYWFVLWYNMGNTEFSTFLNSTELFFHKKIFMMYLRNLVSNKFFFFKRLSTEWAMQSHLPSELIFQLGTQVKFMWSPPNGCSWHWSW